MVKRQQKPGFQVEVANGKTQSLNFLNQYFFGLQSNRFIRDALPTLDGMVLVDRNSRGPVEYGVS